MMTVTETTGAADPAEVERFTGRVVTDLAGAMATVLCALGDRLGLFATLAAGPATSADLAASAGLSERYVREWASGLYAAGYLDHDPETGRFGLPAGHAAVLADEPGPAFLGGAYGTVRGMLAVLDRVEDAFRAGGGVPLDAYGDRFWRDVQRFTGPDFAHRLVQEWIPAVSGLPERLAAGAAVADVGCGAGRAAITLARAYPAATVTGFDILPANVELAGRSARAAGLDGRVRFERRDATQGLPGGYDVITLFGVVHDAADPLALLRAARAALRPDGVCLIQEISSGERLADNRGPAATVLYGFSVLHCLPQSLAAGGEGLGTCGLPEPRLREVCLRAGFAGLDRVFEGPLDTLYAVHP
jgi:2-polyprenyl-3-methyl-5-hydroxy-6-metoxy-1,4-benzoquinol methylase